MAKASINIQPSKITALLHNERVFDVEYTIDSEDKNEYKRIQDLSEYLASVKDDYKAHHGRKLNTKAQPIREAVLNLNKEHNLSDVEALAEQIKEQFGIEPLHLAVHRDEGYKDDNGEKVYNYHAHVVFGWYDFETHRSIKLDKSDMRKMQDLTAKSLKMQRGESKEITKRERLNHRQYKRAMREADARENEALATQKMLKEVNTELRKQLKEQSAKREDYAKLEAEIRELKAQIKSKNLTVSDLQAKIANHKKELEKALAAQKQKIMEKAKEANGILLAKERAKHQQELERAENSVNDLIKINQALQHENKMLKENQPSESDPEPAAKSALESAEKSIAYRKAMSLGNQKKQTEDNDFTYK
jgi:hypothetical protein